MRTVPLKRLCTIVSGSGFPSDLQGNLDESITFYKVGSLNQINKNNVLINPEHTISYETAEKLGATLIPENSCLMAKIGAAVFLQRVALTPSTSCIDNNMMALIPSENTYPRYLFYVLQTIQLEPLMNPGAVPNLNMEYFRNIPVTYPAYNEQVRIADQLDRELAEIDDAISDWEQFQDLSQERLSVLKELLITGFDNNTHKTTNHKISWLKGVAIPEDWQVWKLGRLLRLQSGNSLTSEDIDSAGAYPVYGGGGFRGYTDSFTNDGEHIMIGRQGALCGKIFSAQGKFFATEHAIVTYPNQPVDLVWLKTVLEVMNLGQYSTSAAQPGISVDIISKILIPLPPPHAQIEISTQINSEYQKINNLMQDSKNTINILHEYKKSILNHIIQKENNGYL